MYSCRACSAVEALPWRYTKSLFGCLDHSPVAEQVIDRAQTDLFYLINLRLGSLAVINRELAQHVVDRARLFEDGLFDLFQTVIAIFDLRRGQFAREGVGVYDQFRVD